MSKSNLPSRVGNSRGSGLPKLSPPHPQYSQNNPRQFIRNPPPNGRVEEFQPHEHVQIRSYSNSHPRVASSNISNHIPVSKIPVNSVQFKPGLHHGPPHGGVGIKETTSTAVNGEHKYAANIGHPNDNFNHKEKLHRNLSSGSHYKSVLDLQKITDEELFKQGTFELIKRIRKMEAEVKSMMAEHNALMGDLNKRLHNHLMETQYLKDGNQKLQEDNQELRDLCCFLDDDRQKGRKLAREWQRFGRYTASVMRQEVSAYQNKLRELDGKQQELIRDNLELKELCLYLDEERNHINQLCNHCSVPINRGHRDEGDGSSSSTNADDPLPNLCYQNDQCTTPYLASDGNAGHSSVVRSASHERLLEEGIQRQRNTFNEQILQYIRGLEHKVLQLEEKQLITGGREGDIEMNEGLGPGRLIADEINETLSVGNNSDIRGVQHFIFQSTNADSDLSFEARPPGVVHAMKVLQVHEQLTTGADTEMEEDFGEKERALVREMCNVVWRKLENCSTTK